MHKFLETYNLPKRNQKDPENLNRQVTPSETETVIKKVPTNKIPTPEDFIGEFYQTFQELIPLLLKLSTNSREEKCSQAHFMRPALF